MDALTAVTVDLLQTMIRNECVNRPMTTDGVLTTEGHEHRNRDALMAILEGSGLDIEVVEPDGGRPSLIARLSGSDPDAPSLALVGHMDVVPADEDGWHHDPFGGELIGNRNASPEATVTQSVIMIGPTPVISPKE